MAIGATGKFPRGKLDPSDEGELAMRIGTQGDTVRLEFGTPVAWLAMPKKDAVELARRLLMAAGAKLVQIEF